jgi:hypothetical protein
VCLKAAIALLVAIAALPQNAAADDKWTQSKGVWRAVDNCTRAAIKAFPDYTPDSLAKREANRRQCLRRSNLPSGDDGPPSSH